MSGASVVVLANLIAIIHLIALPLGVAALFLRAGALAAAQDNTQLKRVFFWDTLYAVIALVWIGSGLLRAFAGLDKGTPYYVHNHAFWTKMLLLVVVLGAEFVPMKALLGFRKQVAKGQPVSFHKRRVLLMHHWIELWVIVGMVAMAVLMARGVGVHYSP
jgi:putative membrane protein